jgi:hypothetical protein
MFRCTARVRALCLAAVLAGVSLLVPVLDPLRAQSPAALGAEPAFIPLEKIQPGMTGYAQTIFEGDRIERIELEVVGLLPNLLGPRQDIILVRLKGPRVEHTGVVSGMSGSPVYLAGQLAGALSLRFGLFAKEPLAGVTPIESMLNLPSSDEDRKPLSESREAARRASYPIPGEFAQQLGLGAGSFLAPIETPLVFSGFHPAALTRYAGEFAAYGLVAVPGGTAPARTDDAALQPGDMASLVLMQGDLSVQASCTVSAVVGDRILLCGHPVFGYGELVAPMARGRVVTTLASAMASTKIVNVGGVIGSITDDRLTGVIGRLGLPPRLIPMELESVTPAGRQQYRFELVEHAKLTPLLVGLATLNGLIGNPLYSEGQTFRLTGEIAIEGHTPVNLENMFAPTDLPLPDALFIVNSVQTIFTRIFTNSYEAARINGVRLRVEAVPERRWAMIDSAWSEKSEVSPGEEIRVKVLLKPYRSAPFVREVPITIPPQAPKGQLRILVSDSETLNRMSRFFSLGPQSRLGGLEQLIALLNRERRNHRLYVTLLQPNPTLLLEDKELPNAPLSQIRILDQRRTPGSSLLLRESVAGEWSVQMNQVITGQYVIPVTVR